MDRIQIRGGARLNGVIPISGAKNAALPLMIASLMTDQTLTLENLPRLADVSQMARILGNHGVDYSIDGKRVGEEAASGQTAHLRSPHHRRHDRALRARVQDARELLGHRAAAGANGGGARVAAWRLRDRDPAGRSSADGVGKTRSRHRDRRRLRGREGGERARPARRSSSRK